MTHPSSDRSAPRVRRGSRLPRLLAALALSSLLALPALAQDRASAASPEPACTADYPHRELVAGLQPTTAHHCDGHDLPCWQEGFGKLVAALEQTPDDLNLQLTYQQMHENWPGPDRPRMEKLRREMGQALAERPDDPQVRFLHARTQPSGESSEGLRRAADELPDSPWPLLDLAYLEAVSGEHQDPASSDPHLERFLELCPIPPAWALAYGHVGLGSSELWQRHLPRLRTVVEAMPPFERLAGFYHLWAIEGRSLPLDAQKARRLQPLDDLAVMEAPGLEDTAAYWLRRREAYQRVGDDAGVESSVDEMATRFPCTGLGILARNGRWDQQHDGVLAAARKALLTQNPIPASPELYAATGGWSESCGDGPGGDLGAAELRFAAGLGLLAAAAAGDGNVAAPSPESLWTDAERWIALWEARREVADALRSPYLPIARHLLDQGLDADRAVTLIDQEAEHRAWVRENSEDDGHLAQIFADQRRMGSLHQGLDLNLELLRALTAAERWSRAMATVEESTRLLADLQSMAEGEGPTTARARQLAHRLAVRLWTGRATLARALDRPLDALAFTLRAEALTDPEVAGSAPGSLDAWRDLGGSEQGWRALVATVADQGSGGDRADVRGWETLDRPLDDFDLEDIGGERWRRADLAGQTVLFNVWATWCAPCLEELPLVQKLHERFADDPEVMVVSLNIDREIGRVGPFLEREGYTFPTLLGDDYFQRLLPTTELSVPQTWLVDGEHVLRQRQRGFEMGSAEGLENEIVERLQAMVAED